MHGRAAHAERGELVPGELGGAEVDVGHAAVLDGFVDEQGGSGQRESVAEDEESQAEPATETMHIESQNSTE